MMSRTAVAFAVLIVLAFAQARLDAAPKKRAYKPSQDRQKQQDADAQPSKAASSADTAAPGATYEQEVEAARAKRDKDLQDLSDSEADRRTLEKRKEQIFAQYAQIVAAIRDKYQAAHANDPAPADVESKGPKGKVGRPKPVEPADVSDDAGKAGKSKERNRKSRDSSDGLADAQAKLDEENARHRAKLDELNEQLKAAESSNNTRDVRRVQKAIDKENNSYSARKAILERRVVDLGGNPTPPPPPAPATPPAKPAEATVR
jgi:hypothetical protein